MNVVFKALGIAAGVAVISVGYLMFSHTAVADEGDTVLTSIEDHFIMPCPDIWNVEYDRDHGINNEGKFENWYRVVFTDANENSFEVSYRYEFDKVVEACIRPLPKMAESIVVEPTPTQVPIYVEPTKSPPVYAPPAPRPTKRPVPTPKPTIDPDTYCHYITINGKVEKDDGKPGTVCRTWF